MSTFLFNLVQNVQGARVKPLPPVISGGYTIMEGNGFSVILSNMQILIVVTTITLMAAFSYIIAATPLGRAQRACEQDRTMAALTGSPVSGY